MAVSGPQVGLIRLYQWEMGFILHIESYFYIILIYGIGFAIATNVFIRSRKFNFYIYFIIIKNWQRVDDPVLSTNISDPVFLLTG